MTETLHKTVDLTDEVDDERRIATGVLLTPNEVDTQGDFFRPDDIRRIAHDYMSRLARGDAELKFMHSVPAGEKLSLVENRVLDEPEEIGDSEHDAGTWVVSVKAHHDATWQAFKQGLFGGFSIGGEIKEATTLEPFQLPPDVGVPDDHPDDVPVQRIEDAELNEFSPVDEPAVPKAQVEVLKSDLKKDDRLADPETCTQALMERGHDEQDAELLCEAMHKADDEKRIVLPNGAEFDSFDSCVDSVSGDGTSVEEAERVCGANRESLATKTTTINDTEVDLSPSSMMVNAAEAAAEAGSQQLIPSSCGTGVGDRRRDQIRNAGEEGGLAPDTWGEIAAYLTSHEGDTTTDDPPTTWGEDEWADCGNAQQAKWGWDAEYAQRRVNAIDRARGDPVTYDNVTNMTTEKQEYGQGDWVVWEQAEGDTRGRVVRSITTEGETFDNSEYTGDANVPQADEDDPIYLIEVWDGFGDDASARESSQSGPDTVHVVHLESRMSEVEDPRDREAAAAGLLERAKSLLTPGSTDDAGDSVEDSEGIDMEKVGRTLSQANVRETKTVHDAAATMLEREGHDDHGEARTYTADPDDEFDMAEHHEKMLAKQDIPMPGEAQLLYGDEDTAMSVAEEMGLDGVHEHTLDGETFFMPGETHAEFEDAMGDVGQAGHEDDETEQDYDDDKESEETMPAATATDADSGVDPDNTKMTDDTDDDVMADAPEWAKQLNDRIDDLEADEDETEKSADEAAEKPAWAEKMEERLDRIAAEKADTDQTEKQTTTEDADAEGLDALAKVLG